MVGRYVQLFDRAIELWRKHGEEYRTLLNEYEDLLLQKRMLGISPLNKIKNSILKEYPEIPFLEITDEEEAEDFLLNTEERDLVDIVIAINLFVGSHVYISLKAHLIDYRYEIRNHNRPKFVFGVDPDRCHGNGSHVYRSASSRED